MLPAADRNILSPDSQAPNWKLSVSVEAVGMDGCRASATFNCGTSGLAGSLILGFETGVSNVIVAIGWPEF